jgi:histidinol phosphatase-like enzyme
LFQPIGVAWVISGRPQVVEDHLRKILGQKDQLDGFYFCPHHPDGRLRNYALPCFCRKPNPGMLFKAAREHHLNLAESWMIGDILNDVEAGKRADCRAILVDNGNETGWLLTPVRHPNFITNDLLEAAKLIVDSNRAKNHIGARPFAMRNRPASFPAQWPV